MAISKEKQTKLISHQIDSSKKQQGESGVFFHIYFQLERVVLCRQKHKKKKSEIYLKVNNKDTRMAQLKLFVIFC